MSHHHYLVEAIISDRLRAAELARRRASVRQRRARPRRRPLRVLRPRTA